MMKVHLFNVKTLEQTCYEVLKDHLCPENCIRLWQFTKLWNIHIIFKLQYEAFHFICENFEEVSLCEEFLQLAVQEVADILGQDDLTVTQESRVYQSVLRWINHLPEERQGAISTLLPKVRLGLMDKSYITDNVLNNDVVKTNPESHLLVFKTLKVMSKPSLLRSEPWINSTLFNHRLPNTVLLKLGCLSQTIEAFDYSSNSWFTVQAPPSRLEDRLTHFFFDCSVFLGGCLYILGDVISEYLISKSMWRLNLVSHTWQQMSPMQESRDCFCVTALKGCIYAMGGYRNGLPIRTAERYKPDINQWTFIASMNEERFRASCTTLNNKIYICGGSNKFRGMNSAEYYNPDTNQWTLISPMGIARWGLGAVAYLGHIFAVGGYNKTVGCLRSAEAYNPVTNTWHNVRDMINKHHNFGIAVMNKKIFIVSCYEETIVECYDSTTNTWSVVFSARCSPSYDIVRFCMISGLPNMVEYCLPRAPVIKN